MKHSEKIRIVFDGPPSHESGRFVEVENEHGESMSLGEWKQDGEFWYLEFSNQESQIGLAAQYITQLKKEKEELRIECNRLYGIGQDYDDDAKATRRQNETLKADKRLLMHVVHGRAMASSLPKHLKEE